MNKNKISITLAALALLLGMGAGITSCTDEADNFDPARGNHTAGQLGIVSLSSDGVSLVSDPARTASSRATNDDGTTAATANRAIRSFAADDAVVTRYRFIDIATTPAPEASMHTCAATAEGLGTVVSPLLWKMAKRDANTNPLAPGKDKNPAETWDEARMEITYAAIGTASATPTDPNYGTIVPPTGTDGDAALNRSHMAYHKSSTTIGDAPAFVRQYFDALVASNLSTATASLPGTKPATLAPGALYIERTKSKEQGAVSANLAHRGALLRLTADKTSISGFAEGFDRLTVLLAKATIKAGAAGSQQEEEVYIRFSKVDIAGGAPTEPTRTASAAVWQAIVPDGAVVSQFIATIATADAPTATNPQATYYIALPTATPALTTNTSYPLSLTLTPDTQTLSVGNAPALPGWPNDELEWTNNQNASYTESGDKRTYTEVLNVKGVMEVIDYINGTDNSGTNTANIGKMHLNTDVTLNAGTTYDLSEVYKASADDTSKPDFLPIGTKADGTADPYTGTFDGKGATITGLYIAVSRSYNGLFAKNYGTVTNIKLTKVNISSTERMTINIGGIAGQNGESGTLGSVTNCTVEGELAGISYSTIRLGGVVGYNNYGDVMGCTSNVTLTDTGSNANSYIGGVVGHNDRGNVMGCTAAGTVSNNTPGGTSYAGGVVGYNEYGSIVACISTANVNNKSTNRTYAYTGGVAGYSTGSSIYACYNTGAVYGAVTAKTHGVTWNEGRFYVKAAYWMKPSSPESNATDIINTAGYAEYVEKLKDISSLNDKVDAAKNQGGLNLYIKAWNTDYPQKLCNYKFKAGNNARTPPTIVAGRPQ